MAGPNSTALPGRLLPVAAPAVEGQSAGRAAHRIKRPAAHLAVSPLVRCAFYLFVFSIPFEYPPRSIPVEVHTITGSIFLLIALLQPNICFRRAPRAFWWFSAYVFVYLFLTILFSKHFGEAMIFFFNLLQALLLFWTSYNLLRYEAIVRTTLLTFAISVAALATMLVLDIGTTVYVSTSEGNRVTVLGQDPNTVAANMSLGIIALIGLAYGLHEKRLRFRILIWPIVALLAASLILTGSRGGTIALGLGFLAFTLKRGNLLVMIRNFIIVLSVLGAAGFIAINTEPMKSRYNKSVKKGDMAGRQFIIPIAIDMFEEKPFFGWGPVNEQYELGARTKDFEFGDPGKAADRKTRDTHNLVLRVLTATGLAGAIPLFICIALCLRAGWRARASTQGVLPFALALVVLMVNMTVPWQAAKQGWLVFAYAVAYGGYSITQNRRRSAQVAGQRQQVLSQPTQATYRVPRAIGDRWKA